MKTVAVKTTSTNSRDVGAIANELRCYGQLKARGDADHVVSVVGVCLDGPGGHVRLVMEYCAAGTVLQYVTAQPRVRVSIAALHGPVVCYQCPL